MIHEQQISNQIKTDLKISIDFDRPQPYQGGHFKSDNFKVISLHSPGLVRMLFCFVFSKSPTDTRGEEEVNQTETTIITTIKTIITHIVLHIMYLYIFIYNIYYIYIM